MSMFMSNVISIMHNSGDQCMYIYQRLCTFSCELLLCCDLLLHCHTIVCQELWTLSNMCHQRKHVFKQPTHTSPRTTNIRHPQTLKSCTQIQSHAFVNQKCVLCGCFECSCVMCGWFPILFVAQTEQKTHNANNVAFQLTCSMRHHHEHNGQ